ncbi:alginate lyase family protein [uncultured Aquimarina sp.]|uniref:alginate lyase family protein n=1 Tax=uncultured Aquimarina sp. TaxID=575652 RepID=UPI00262206CF|nr:alginate lyase family protein [uncultured Aquimarina sp.]
MISAIRYYYTIKNLHPIQVIYRLKYILKRNLYERNGSFFFKRLEKKFKKETTKINADLKFVLNERTYYLDEINEVLENKISFLNHKINFDQKIVWHSEELNQGTRLWKLNLNYHEFLFDIAFKYKETKDQKYIDYIENTVSEWFVQNPLGTKGYGKDNWNSYAISLRLISWIKIYTLVGREFTKKFESFFLKLLWIQAEFLSQNPELDILGNHLIKNWKALIWCKHFFSTSRFDKEIRSVEKFVYPQFSDFGMHEEYSPMYAGIVLEDLMEVFLFQKNNEKLENLIHKQFNNVRLLSNVNQYLFFNDSVDNNGIQFDQLNDFYYKIFKREFDQKEEVFDINGFIGVKTDKEHLVFDCAKVVGGNQPGHVHCDALSFEYFRGNEKIFTNSGTYEYNSGSRREYSRATESHNVLQYDDFNQSEVWSSFRMAREASVDYNTKCLEPDNLDIEGTVKGYDFSNEITHKRRLIKKENTIIIKDTLIASTDRKSKLFFHLTPDFNFINGKIVEKETNRKVATIQTSNSYEVVSTEFYPEFGIWKEKETMIVCDIAPNEEVTTEIVFNE